MATPGARAEREFDVVLFGATGFVGRLTAAYLAENAPAEARIALAGRDELRLEALRRQLPRGARDWAILLADSSEPTTLAALAARTRVVATTVGPYAMLGMPLVEACAMAGTHYCDLTGEVLFVRESADSWHEIAKDSGAKIVHGCGFDAIPSDLGVLVTADKVAADGEGELTRTLLSVRSLKGGLSGRDHRLDAAADHHRPQRTRRPGDPRRPVCAQPRPCRRTARPEADPAARRSPRQGDRNVDQGS
ncbi:MAG: saccharopine dehydrogenase NADP-binding domain-containing protein [Dermatophilaceae bacterium]